MHPWTARWLTGAVAVPAVLAVAALAVQGNQIQDQVRTAARAELGKVGESEAGVVVDGRAVTLTGVPFERMADTVRAVSTVSEVASVRAAEPSLSPLRIDVTDEHLVVAGTTQQEAWRQRFLKAIGEYARGRTVVDHTTTVVDTDFAMTTTAVAALVSVLTVKPGTDVSVTVAEGHVVVDGLMPDQTSRTSAIELLKRLFGTGVLVDKTHVYGSPR